MLAGTHAHSDMQAHVRIQTQPARPTPPPPTLCSSVLHVGCRPERPAHKSPEEARAERDEGKAMRGSQSARQPASAWRQHIAPAQGSGQGCMCVRDVKLLQSARGSAGEGVWVGVYPCVLVACMTVCWLSQGPAQRENDQERRGSQVQGGGGGRGERKRGRTRKGKGPGGHARGDAH